MPKSRLLSLLLILLLSACQLRSTVTTPTATFALPQDPTPAPTETTAALSDTPTAPPDDAPTTGPDGKTIDFTTRAGQGLAEVSLQTYQPGAYGATLDALPLNIDALGNPAVIAGLTAQQVEFLQANGFVVIDAGDTQFKDLRRMVATRHGQPYYLTTDAAYHALHVTFNDLLAALEEEYLRPVLARLLRAEMDKVTEYAQSAAGSPLAADAELAQSYLAVALKLLYPTAVLDPQLEERVAPQIDQIMRYGGKEMSVLIPEFMDDYGAYRPVSHYAGDPELETYFRAMTWFGRVAWKLQDPDAPGLAPSRAPLLMTLALREAEVEGQPAYQVWASLHEIMDFVVGPSDDSGPVELNALMEAVYGPAPALNDLADEAKWSMFLARVNELPAPQIHSTFASTSAVHEASRDWRFLGQRFTLDGFIFQSLIFDKVGTQAEPRGFPTGLDVAAAFGSTHAWDALVAMGEPRYANYTRQMEFVQGLVRSQPEAEWLNRFYSSWLYAFLPQVQPKDSASPPYMRTDAWGYKEVNSMLGSWAELKHDTVLYAKMPEGLGGGGPPTSGPPPSYVEPNPNVFYRLAYAATALHQGLEPFVTDWEMRGWNEPPPGDSWTTMTFHTHFEHLGSLAERFQALADIAGRELGGQPLTADDFTSIQQCLELKECMDRGMYTNNAPEQDPIPVVAAVSGWDNSVLEAGVGQLNRIYVAVPLEGKLQIAQGGVFSYHEFIQPRSDRLTDEAWREMLETNPPPAPAWVSKFFLPGGEPTDALAFRIGDVYVLTEAGYTPPLNLRESPSTAAPILRKLDQEFYLTIIDGPVENEAGRWWKVELFDWSSDVAPQGWVVENQDWYRRSVTE